MKKGVDDKERMDRTLKIRRAAKRREKMIGIAADKLAKK
jgi:hypothetical protein